MIKSDIKKIGDELISIKKPDDYINNLEDRVFSIDDNLSKILLLNYANINHLSFIIKDLDDENKKNLFNKLDLIWKKVIKLIENDPKLQKNDKKNILIYLKWVPYIVNYKTSLNEIKDSLEKCNEMIDKITKKWEDSNNWWKLDVFSIIYKIKSLDSQEKTTICATLRRIIETIFELQILNNEDCCKKKFKYKNFSYYYKFLNSHKINWKIRTLYVEECEAPKYKYAISKIWKNEKYLKKDIYQKLLSNNIHQQFKNLISINFCRYHSCIYNCNSYLVKQYEELKILKKLLLEITLTLKNHLISFEKEKLTIVIKNFDVDVLDLNEKYFDVDKDYVFEEIKNVKDEYLVDLFKSFKSNLN